MAELAAADPAPALDLRGVGKQYAGRRVLRGIDLQLPAGRIHALLGANGAGKTTVLKIVLGLVRPDSGTVALLGWSGRDAARAPEGGVAGFVDDPRFWPNLTAAENLAVLAALDGFPDEPADRVTQALAGVGLAESGRLAVSGFSLGMRQRLGLAAALLRRPALLVLDEPANGLDPDAATELWEILRELAAQGTAVLLSSHDLIAVDSIADDLTVLRDGAVAWSGPLAVLRRQAPDPRYVLSTADDQAAAVIAAAVGLLEGSGGTDIRLRATLAELDQLTVDLGRAGIGVRSLVLSAPPLRTLFTALTTGDGVAPVRPEAVAAPQPAPTEPATPTPRLLGAAVATELSRLRRQTRVRLMLGVCLLAPVAFALVVGLTGTLPADTLYGRWLTESGAALPLVVLAFAASWAFPLLGSVIAGDLLAAEDRLGTWPTLLTRSVRRRTIVLAKCLVAAASTVTCVALVAVSATVSGLVLAGRTPLIGLSGQVIGPGVALRLVAVAWAASIPTALAWTALALVLSALTRTAIVGIAGPAVLGVLGQLATLVDGPPVLRRLLLSSTLEGWHGLAEIPSDATPLLTAVLVGLGWTAVGVLALTVVLSRRDPVESRGGS